jgi:hypothetical protein
MLNTRWYKLISSCILKSYPWENKNKNRDKSRKYSVKQTEQMESINRTQLLAQNVGKILVAEFNNFGNIHMNLAYFDILKFFF